MRILFLNRYFYPDHSATSQILSDLAFHLAATGKDIHVVTSRQIIDDPAAQLSVGEKIRGVQIHRVATTRFGRSHLIGRALDYLSFYWSMWRRVMSLARAGDILVAKTDPPLTSVVAIVAARRRSAHLINWLQDLYPEIAIALGVPLLKGPLGKVIGYFRNRSLRLADTNVVVGTAMATRLRGLWRRTDPVSMSSPIGSMMRRLFPFHGRKSPSPRLATARQVRRWISGNLGRAHEFQTLLGAAERLREEKHIVFVFIGGGKHFDELRHQVQTRNLDQAFRFFPYQERGVLKYSLSVPDVHWVSLPPKVEGLIFPSKLYGILAAGRPVIAVTDTDGELASLIRDNKCGYVVASGNSDSLYRSILFFANDVNTRKRMAAQARATLDAKFARRLALTRWQQLLARF